MVTNTDGKCPVEGARIGAPQQYARLVKCAGERFARFRAGACNLSRWKLPRAWHPDGRGRLARYLLFIKTDHAFAARGGREAE